MNSMIAADQRVGNPAMEMMGGRGPYGGMASSYSGPITGAMLARQNAMAGLARR